MKNLRQLRFLLLAHATCFAAQAHAEKAAPGPASATASAGADAAQVAASAGPQDTRDDTGDIVVTARKRSESVLDVPISITAFSGEQLQRAGISSVTDIQNSVPNLQYSPRGELENQISVRGVGGDPRNVGTESGVSLYIDGVFAGRTTGYNQDLSNIAQLEVLRGPQGTLFGKNTTGGVINIVTEKPSDVFKASLQGSYGNYNALVLKGSASGPITSNLSVGVTLAATNRDGYVHNLFDGRDLDNVNRRGGRLQLKWDSPAGVNFYWTADRTVNTIDFALTQLAAPFVGTGLPYASVNDRFNVSVNASNLEQLRTTGLSQTIDYPFADGHTLTSVTGFRKSYVNVYSDSDALPTERTHSGPFTDDTRFFSQELRLASPSSGLIRYVVGAYYFHQKASAYRAVYVLGSLPNGFESTAVINTDAIAGFANVDIHPVDALTITGGIRYTSEKKSGSFTQLNSVYNYNFSNLYRRDNDVSWTASANYRFGEGVSVYATASRGFKSGGFNVEAQQVAGVTPAALSFAPENLTNLEIGTKGRLWRGLLSYSGSLFYDTFDNKQVSQFLPGASIPVIQVGNAAKARIKGFELEATLRPVTGLSLSGSVSRLETRYLSFPDAAVVGGVRVSYTGNRLENAPASSVSGVIDYRLPVNFGFLSFRGDLRHTGSTYFQPDNAAVNLQDAYTIFGGRVGFETKDELTTVSVWAKNLTDKSYYVFSRVNGGNHLVLYGEPRMYGVELTRKF